MFIRKYMLTILTCMVLLVCVLPASSTVYDTYNYTDIDQWYDHNLVVYSPIDFGMLYTGFPGIGVQLAWGSSSYKVFSMYSSNGDETFTSLGNFHLWHYFTGPVNNVTGDLNGDDCCDLFTRGEHSDSINITRLAIPSGGMGDPYYFISPTPTSIWGAGDMDGDSPPDLYGTSQGSVVVWCGTGSGQFDVVEVSSGLSAVNAFAADLDLDDDLDIVVTGSNEIHVLLNEGDLVFSDIGTYGPLPSVLMIVSLDDLNGDGYIDIIAGCYPSSGEDAFHTYLNDGFGYFDYGASFLTDQYFDFFSVQDLDMDGCGDLAVLYDWDIDIYKGDGAGSFQLVGTLFSMSDISPFSVVFDDYDCDGDLDMGCATGIGPQFYLRSYWNTTYTQGCGGGGQFSDGFSLNACSNPFRNGVTITVSEGIYPPLLDVVDLTGRLVTQIPPESEGMYLWDGKSISGELAPAGVYIVHAEVSGTVATLRLVKLD